MSNAFYIALVVALSTTIGLILNLLSQRKLVSAQAKNINSGTSMDLVTMYREELSRKQAEFKKSIKDLTVCIAALESIQDSQVDKMATQAKQIFDLERLGAQYNIESDRQKSKIKDLAALVDGLTLVNQSQAKQLSTLESLAESLRLANKELVSGVKILSSQLEGLQEEPEYKPPGSAE